MDVLMYVHMYAHKSFLYVIHMYVGQGSREMRRFFLVDCFRLFCMCACIRVYDTVSTASHRMYICIDV